MSYKLPYIPDKNLYAAVMGACSWIKDSGYFNKSVNYYADKYGVDPNEVARYVRLAQGNGQKKANSKRPPRKYHWFAVEFSMGNERNGADYFDETEAQYIVAKGLRADSVEDRLSKHDDYISEYSPCHWFGRCEPFDSEEEAKTCIEEWKEERRNHDESNISS